MAERIYPRTVNGKTYYYRLQGHRGGRTLVVADGITANRIEIRDNIGWWVMDDYSDAVKSLVKTLESIPY